jgi:hypothetical protein
LRQCRSGCRRIERLQRSVLEACGHHLLTQGDLSRAREVLDEQLVGAPHGGHEHTAVPGRVLNLRRDGHGVVGDEGHDRERRADHGHTTHEATVADHGSVDADAVIGALVNLDGRVPERGITGDQPRGHGVVGAHADAVVETDQTVELGILERLGLRGGELGTKRLHLMLELIALRLGVEGVREPARDIADGLQGTARAVLNRGEHLHDAALQAVQRAARRLPEVCGERYQGDDDEQQKDCPSPPNLLVVHEIRVSKVVRGAMGTLVPTAPIAGILA